jgi:hypothetical protein
MKVYLKRNLAGYTGTVDEAIFYYNPKIRKTLMRPYRYPTLNHNNERTVSIMANLKALNPSQGYKANLSDYVMYYNERKEFYDKPMVGWSNAWLKLMFALQKMMPAEVDLRTITRQQIIDQNLPCRTVKDAIEAGLLPPLPDYERWTAPI